MLWTDEAIAEMRCLAESGLTTRQIADRLGTTKNSVIGKMRRIGIPLARKPGGGTGGSKARRKRRVRVQPKPIMDVFAMQPSLAPTIEPEPMDIIPVGQRRSIMELNRYMCRWIVGDPKTPDHYYCGGPVVDNCSWCAAHLAKLYTESQPRPVRSYQVTGRKSA